SRVLLTQADVKDAAAPAITLLEIVAKTGLVPSKSEGRRLIVQGGVELDEQKMIDPNAVVTLSPGRQYRLRVGRKKFAVAEYRS
ncbi:MAG TPA: S4 domain-containing protein, partial [Nitrospiraceae bacterium]|nr:S4 domain-containing protein [Nitrospiraceae bacterium]